MLNSEEISRYQRHIQLSEIGIEGQEKLKKSSVLVIGAGGLGCPVLQYLTAMGVGTIGIIDFDKVSVSNLQRQILYNANDIGKNKVDVAAKVLSIQNPNVNFVTYSSQLTNKNALDIIAHYDVVVDGTDNFSTRYLINDACVILNKPLVFGAIHKFEGQVSVFNYNKINSNIASVNYRDLFPIPPSSEESPNCSEVGVIGVLPGIVGTIQATEVLKIITGIGSVLSGELLLFNTFEMQFYKVQISKAIKNKVFSIGEYINENYGQSCVFNSDEDVLEISSFDLEELLKIERDAIQLVDVREVDELPLVPDLIEINIPLNDIINRISEIDQSKKVVFICKSGSRSKKAILELKKDRGVQNFYSLKGGVLEWLNCKIIN